MNCKAFVNRKRQRWTLLQLPATAHDELPRAQPGPKSKITRDFQYGSDQLQSLVIPDGAGARDPILPLGYIHLYFNAQDLTRLTPGCRAAVFPPLG
jgi:hypothetical protein